MMLLALVMTVGMSAQETKTPGQQKTLKTGYEVIDGLASSWCGLSAEMEKLYKENGVDAHVVYSIDEKKKEFVVTTELREAQLFDMVDISSAGENMVAGMMTEISQQDPSGTVIRQFVEQFRQSGWGLRGVFTLGSKKKEAAVTPADIRKVAEKYFGLK